MAHKGPRKNSAGQQNTSNGESFEKGSMGEGFASDHFKRNAEVRETEIKFLYKAPANTATDNSNGTSPPPHKQLLQNIKNYFADQGWIKHPVDADGNIQSITTELLSRQFDVPSQKFLKEGHTLRVRGDCPDGNLYNVQTADICIKTGKSLGNSGQTQRGEYEAHIKNFNRPALGSLHKKYPAGENPELDKILKEVKQEKQNLVEFFRIDDMRTRYHMVIPESEHGIKGKNVVVELVTDELVYVSELLSELLSIEDPIFLDNKDHEAEIEVEAEVVTKPDEHAKMPLPNGVPGYSDDLTEEETQHVMTIVKDHILKAGLGMLHTNSYSKAERGFHRFNEKVEKLAAFLPEEFKKERKLPVQSLRNTFINSASNDNESFQSVKRDAELSALAQETKARKEKILAQRRIALRL